MLNNITLKLGDHSIDVQVIEALKENKIFMVNLEDLSVDVYPDFKVFRYQGKPFLRLFPVEIEHGDMKSTLIQRYQRIRI